MSPDPISDPVTWRCAPIATSPEPISEIVASLVISRSPWTSPDPRNATVAVRARPTAVTSPEPVSDSARLSVSSMPTVASPEPVSARSKAGPRTRSTVRSPEPVSLAPRSSGTPTVTITLPILLPVQPQLPGLEPITSARPRTSTVSRSSA